MFFCAERAVHVSVDLYDPARSWHLELKVCLVWHRIESSECGSSKQCVIASAKRDNIEDQLFASEVVRGSEDDLQCDRARAANLYTWYNSFKGSFGGLDP